MGKGATVQNRGSFFARGAWGLDGSSTRQVCTAWNLRPTDDKRSRRVQPMPADPEEQEDRLARFEVGLARRREFGGPMLRLIRIGSLA